MSLRGLSAPVTVTRDTYGIPHIRAANKLDALKALGYVMASERLFQMELSRRMTQGQLSEVFGEVALPSDKLYRSLMLKRSIERMLAEEKKQNRFDQKLWDQMQAYFDGVNEFINTRPLPPELKLLGLTPAAFTPVDGYVMTGHMAYSFGIALKADPLMTELAQKLSNQQIQDLRNDPLSGPFRFAQVLQNSFKAWDLASEGVFGGHFEGSNAWLIGPSRSQSGKSLFANDPHIGFSAPAVWVEAHIQTPDFELYGHYLPLVPFAILGHNRFQAWGFTMSLVDDMDLYREVLDRENKTALFLGKPKPYQEWQEVIKVKGQPDLVLPMIETPHGPLMDEVLEEKNLALKWAFHRLENNPMKALHDMGESRTLENFEKALQHATAPGLNVMYADPQNIAWWIFGDLAVKKNPHSDMILDGASGKDEYLRILSWKEKPHSVNPKSGVIVTANSRPPGLDAKIRGDWQAEDRLRTITEALEEKDIWNLEELKSLQTENFNAKNRLILDQLLSHLELSPEELRLFSEEIKSLRTWDFRSLTSSKAASLFYLWNQQVALALFDFLDQDALQAYLNTPYAYAAYQRALLEQASSLWTAAEKKEKISAAFKKVFAQYPKIPPWGDLHTIEYKHPLGRIFLLDKLFNIGPFPAPGSHNEINNMKMRSFGIPNFDVVAGPSTRRLIDFSRPGKSWGINPIGISGHLLSPFYDDQVQLFLDGKYREQWMDAEDIQRHKTYELVLE